MSDKIVTRRGIYLYINGQEVKNDIKSVRSEMMKLVNDQARMTVGSEEYVRTGQKIKALDGIIKQHNQQWRGAKTEIDGAHKSFLSFSKAADMFNRYFAMLTTFIASITGITFAVRKCVDQFAELEEEEANVRKYTGMTKEGVKELNEEFKKMDTRTARTELNQLAADAGRLGLKRKAEILEFVEAANIVKIALGEDLGEDAIKNIGKLTEMFGARDEKGLKQGMLSVASSINELAQNSSAAEGYLLAFTARVAGSSKQAKIAMTDIMGYASALDQDMQQVEMSATAVQTVIMKMFQEPAKFAKMAGKSVSEFTALLKKDTNEALLQLLSTLNAQGGLDKLAPMFKDMQLDGVRAAGVLSNLATNVEKIRGEQTLAKKAFDEGTSATNEYNVKNTTLQATIDKSKKKFQEYAYLLGEKLAPYASDLISKGGSLLKIISTITDVLIKHSGVIITLVSSLAIYIAMQKLVYVWNERHVVLNKLLSASLFDLNTRYLAMNTMHRLLIFDLKGAKESFLALLKTLKINPWVAAITVIGTAAVALYQWHLKAKEAASSASKLASLNEEVAKSTVDERTALKLLTDVARDETMSKEKREAAIKKLNEISPEYLGNLTLETINTTEATASIEEYTRALEANAKMKALSTKMSEVESKKLDLDRERMEIQPFFDRAVVGSESYRIYEDKLGRIANKMKELNELGEFYIQIYKEVEKSVPVPGTKTKTINDNGNGGGGNGDTEERLKKANEALEAKYAERVLFVKQQYIQGKRTQEQMQDDLYVEEMRFLYARMELYKSFGESTVEIETSLSDKIIAEAKRKTDAAKKEIVKQDPEEEEQNPFWAELAKGVEIQIAMNESLYQAGLISHQEYQYKKAILDEQYRKGKEQKDREAAEKEIAIRESILGAISSLSGTAVSFIKTAQAKEEKAIEEKYKYKLILAEGDNEATAELEKQKEAELLSIRKQYADKAFQFQVLSITAETAVAAMRAYAAALALGPLGIPLAPIMAATAIAAGAAQIAVANQQRQEAANMWDGGYTGTGQKYEKKKLIQTHGGEFVANKNTVKILRPVFDIMDYAQRTGNVAALTGPEMANAIGGTPTKINSGSTTHIQTEGADAYNSGEVVKVLSGVVRTLSMLNKKLDHPFVGEVSITGEKGLERKMKEYQKLIDNASR